MSVTKLAEHLYLLVPHGAEVLNALSSIRNAATMPSNKSGSPILTEPPSLKFFKDPNIAFIAKAFAKKFPDLDSVNKTSKEYKEFVESFKELKEELRPIYNVFSVWADFIEASRNTLTNCAKLTCLSLETNPDITQNLLFLSHYIVSSILLLSRIGKGKKAIALAVVILDSRTGMVMDSSFSKITELFEALDKPYQFISDMFNCLSAKLVHFLGNIKIEVSSGPMATVETLRKSGLFGIAEAACSDPTAPITDDIRLRMLSHLSTYSQSVISVLFACSSDTLNDQNALTLLKLAISNGTVSGIGGDEMFRVGDEFDLQIKANSKLSKLKTTITEAVNKQKQMSSKFHKDRREYLAHSMSQMLGLCRDNPALLGPKFPLILASMNFARDEILHYFIQLEELKYTALVKGAGTKNTTIPNHEPDILPLLRFLVMTRQLVMKNMDLIIHYQCSLVKNSYSESINSAFSALISHSEQFPEPVMAVIRDMVSSYESASPSNPGAFKAFRLNWARLQVYLSLPECAVPIASIPQATRGLNEVCSASQAIDELPNLITRASHLHPMIKFTDSLTTLLMNTINAPLNHPTITVLDVVGPLAAELASMQSSDGLLETPAPQPHIDKAIEFATTVYEKFAAATAAAIIREAQLKAVLEQKAMWDGVDMKAKVLSTEAFTSTESNLAYATHPLKPLENLQIQLSDLVSSFSSVPVIKCAAFELRPVVALENALSDEINNLMHRIAFDPNANNVPQLGDEMSYAIHTPSIIMVQLKTIFAELYAVTSLIPGFQLAPLIASALKNHCNASHVSAYTTPLPEQLFQRPPASPIKRSKPGPPRTAPNNLPFSVVLAHWYADLLTSRIWMSGLMYNPDRKALVQTRRPPNSIKDKELGAPVWRPENFVDIVQLHTFARLVGPQGMQLLDSRMVPYIMAAGTSIVSQINGLAGHLIASHIGGAGALVANLNKIRAILNPDEDVTDRIASLGMLLEARSIIREAKRNDAMTSCIHFVASQTVACCKAVHMNKHEEGHAEKWKNLHEYADWLGIDDDTNDTTIRQAFDFIKQLNITSAGISTFVIFMASCLCAGALYEAPARNGIYSGDNFNRFYSIASGVQLMLEIGLRKHSTVTDADRDRIAENVFSMAAEWILLLYRAQITGETIGREKEKVRNAESTWMVLQRFAKLLGKRGEVWLERYGSIAFDKAIQTEVIRRSNQYRRRRLVGSRGQLLDQEEVE